MFFRQLVTTTLEIQNTVVLTANSAVEAVERIERGERFDALISDIEMPMMDGYEFAEWLRSRPATAELPLVALTSLNAATSESRALQDGFNRHLTKFDAQQLIDCLNDLCGQTQTHTEVSA